MMFLPHQCAALVDLACKKGFKPATIFRGADERHRVTQVCFLYDRETPEVNRVRELGIKYAQSIGVKARRLEYVQIGMYGEGSFYDWHHDIDWRPDAGSHRKISLSVPLNIGFEGGLLEFDEVPLRASPIPGMPTFFPSYLRHRVTPITKGVRFSLTAWLEGPRWT